MQTCDTKVTRYGHIVKWPIVFLFIVVLSLIVNDLSLVGSVSAQSKVVADGGSTNSSAIKYASMSPADKAKSIWYYHALKNCFNNAEWVNFSEESNSFTIAHGTADWGGGTFNLNITNKGALVSNELPDDDDDFIYGCHESDSVVIKKAFSLWGVNALEFVCDSGMAESKRTTGQSCKTPSAGENTLNKKFNDLSGKYDQYMKSYVFGSAGLPGNVSSAGAEVAYVYNLSTFDHGCATGKNTEKVGVPISRRKSDGVTMTTVYYDIDKTKTIPYSNDVNMTCGNLAESLTPGSSLAKGYSEWANSNKEKAAEDVASNNDSSSDSDGENACQVDGIGWIVCPVITFLGKAADTAYDMVEGMLKVNVQVINSQNLKNTHKAFLDIANAGFIIVFIIVIYAQIMGVGSGSIGATYQLKKIAPRLLVAAVLVNLSYYISTLAVDLSNIAGSSVRTLIDVIPTTSGASTSGVAETIGQGITWTAITGATIGIATGLVLAISGPVLLASMLAIAMMLLIVMGRQAAIILLIAISPLAFLAWVLPNTESLFKKWWKMLSSMLLLYPIVSVVFSGSQLAANIVANAGDTGGWAIQATSMGIATIPFFVVPSLLKGALNGLGSVGAKLSGVTDKLNSRVGKSVKDTSRLGALNEARKREAQIKQASIIGGKYTGRGPIAKVSSRASRAFNNSKLSGRYGNSVSQQAAALMLKLKIEKVEASSALIQNARLDDADLAIVSNGGSAKGVNGADASTRAAAMQEQLKRGDFNGLETSWDNMINSGDSKKDAEMRETVADAFSMKDKPGFVGESQLQSVASSSGNYKQNTFSAMAASGGVNYSAESIAKTSRPELDYVMNANNQNGTAESKNNLQKVSAEAIANPDVSKTITGKTMDNIQKMSRGDFIPPPPPSAPPSAPPPSSTPPSPTPPSP